jgi:hypothetical protein
LATKPEENKHYEVNKMKNQHLLMTEISRKDRKGCHVER